MSAMGQELELKRPRVTEIQVRMDCHGCVQKVKKALNGINGIIEVRINYPEQKITILGLADPEKLVKAIRKTRKTATICAHFEPEVASEQPAEDEPSEGRPGQAAPPPEPPKEQPSQPTDIPQQVTADQPQSISRDNPPLEAVQSVPVIYHQQPDSYSSTNAYSPHCAPELNHFQHVDGFQTELLHQPQRQRYTEQVHNQASYMPLQQMYRNYQSPQVLVTHNYNTRITPSQTYTFQPPPAVQDSHGYQLRMPSTQTSVLQQLQESHNYQLNRPSPHTYVIQPTQHVQQPQRHGHGNFMSPPSPKSVPSQQHLHFTSQLLRQDQTIYNNNNYIPPMYVTEYDYIHPPATQARYNRMARHYDDNSYTSSSSYGNISSMFSDENPNACNIM